MSHHGRHNECKQCFTSEATARMLRTRPHISNEHSLFNPSGWMDDTSSRLGVATTRWPSGQFLARVHFRELVTDDGWWKVVTTLIFGN